MNENWSLHARPREQSVARLGSKQRTPTAAWIRGQTKPSDPESNVKDQSRCSCMDDYQWRSRWSRACAKMLLLASSVKSTVSAIVTTY